MNIVLVHESFWQHLASLPHLGVLRCTSKTTRAECDPGFAVNHMGISTQITKMWATRWLGLSASWMYLGEKLTLCLALKIAAQHGGISVTYKRGVEVRTAENKRRTNKAKLIAEKAKQDADREEQLRIARQASLKARIDAFDKAIAQKGIPKEEKPYSEITESGMFRWADGFNVDDHVRRYRASVERFHECQRLRVERTIVLNARLKAANIPCEGRYYRCITHSLGFAELDDRQFAEICFRHHCLNHPGLHDITKRLAHLRRVEHTGITSYFQMLPDVFTRFRALYHVDESGNIGEQIRQLRPLRPKE
jgi:hypothetical protein